MATRTKVWWHELRCLIGGNLTIDVVAHAWRGVAVDVIEVILQAIPREDLKEGMQQGDVSPYGAEKNGTLWRLVADEVLQLQLEGCCCILDPERHV